MNSRSFGFVTGGGGNPSFLWPVFKNPSMPTIVWAPVTSAPTPPPGFTPYSLFAPNQTNVGEKKKEGMKKHFAEACVPVILYLKYNEQKALCPLCSDRFKKSKGEEMCEEQQLRQHAPFHTMGIGFFSFVEAFVVV